MSANLSAIFYLVSGILFILALRGLSSPETSRRGNLFGILGMIIAITVTFLSIGNFSIGFIYVLIFLLAGGSIGTFIAYKIPMTAMPELVAGFHSLVGLAAVFVAISAFLNPQAFNLGLPSDIKISNNKSKIKFEMNNGVLISKVIDGRFPDYSKVVPKDNVKILQIKLNEFKNSIERVITVSSDRKEGLKMNISKDFLQLSVNSPNSGEGIENINVKFNSDDMDISFNSRYLIDIASQIENDIIIINLKDAASPVLIKDLSDKNSFHVVMPMKI